MVLQVEQLGQKQIEITEQLGQKRMEMFQPIEEKNFKARCIEITADFLEVSIGGKDKPVTGKIMKAENTDNPSPLQITVEDGKVTRSENVLHIPSGVILVTSEKDFEPLRELKMQKGLRVRDPDIVKIDGRTYRQVGTLHIRISNAFVSLG